LVFVNLWTLDGVWFVQSHYVRRERCKCSRAGGLIWGSVLECTLFGLWQLDGGVHRLMQTPHLHRCFGAADNPVELWVAAAVLACKLGRMVGWCEQHSCTVQEPQLSNMACIWIAACVVLFKKKGVTRRTCVVRSVIWHASCNHCKCKADQFICHSASAGAWSMVEALA
jgi:hypothetical protein